MGLMYMQSSFYRCCLLWLLFFTVTSAVAQPKLSAPSKQLQLYCKSKSASSIARLAIPSETANKFLLSHKRGEWWVNAFIEAPVALSSDFIKKYGLENLHQVGDIYSVSIPLSNYLALCEDKTLTYIEIAEQLYPIMWETLNETGTLKLHNGESAIGTFTGKDVVVGVIDIGFDYTHPNFFDRSGERLRIKAVWNQEDTTVSPPQDFGYGQLVEGEEAILQSVDRFGQNLFHGSHTAGIAAGSGFGTNGRHTGIAPDADLVLVSSSLRTDKVVDATKFIFDYAERIGKPAVINMSFGTWWGAMDGSKAFDRSLSALTGRGKIIVAAMGNEGQFLQHLQHHFESSTDTLRTIAALRNAKGGPNRDPAVAEIWGQTGDEYFVNVSLVNKDGITKNVSGWRPLNGKGDTVDISNDVLKISIITYDAYPNNQRPYAQLSIETSTDTLEPLIKLYSLKGKGGINIYMPFTNLQSSFSGRADESLPGYKSGDTLRSGRSPGVSAERVIGVGAYVDKNIIYSWNGGTIDIPTSENPFTIGQYAPFSSRGPSLDGRNRPDVTAAGVVLVSSYNSFINISDAEREGLPRASEAIFDFRGRTYHWVFASGTSMASPVVTGTVALMLQANPNLDYFDAVKILQRTARSDAFTGPILPNNAWGYGKIHPEEAVKAALLKRENAAPLAYPVPFSNRLTIADLSSYSPNARVTLTDVSGRKVRSQQLGGTNTLIWDTNNIAPGIYLLNIKDFSKSATLKLVKYN
jgi:subtilisin family serine protease